jgi:hypothetical protein
METQGGIQGENRMKTKGDRGGGIHLDQMVLKAVRRKGWTV